MKGYILPDEMKILVLTMWPSPSEIAHHNFSEVRNNMIVKLIQTTIKQRFEPGYLPNTRTDLYRYVKLLGKIVSGWQ